MPQKSPCRAMIDPITQCCNQTGQTILPNMRLCGWHFFAHEIRDWNCLPSAAIRAQFSQRHPAAKLTGATAAFVLSGVLRSLVGFLGSKLRDKSHQISTRRFVKYIYIYSNFGRKKIDSTTPRMTQHPQSNRFRNKFLHDRKKYPFPYPLRCAGQGRGWHADVAGFAFEFFPQSGTQNEKQTERHEPLAVLDVLDLMAGSKHRGTCTELAKAWQWYPISAKNSKI